MTDWHIYKGTGEPHSEWELPAAPPWRTFGFDDPARGITYQANEEEIDLVNAALYLRRPLFITGKPGVGKSSLAYAVAHELNLGDVLLWPITSKSSRQDGLYTYDALARFQDAAQLARQHESQSAEVS